MPYALLHLGKPVARGTRVASLPWAQNVFKNEQRETRELKSYLALNELEPQV